MLIEENKAKIIYIQNIIESSNIKPQLEKKDQEIEELKYQIEELK